MPRPSKIAKLPKDIRAWLESAMIDRAFGDIVALSEELNALCKKSGVDTSVGKSAVGIESKRLKALEESIGATTRAMVAIAKSSPDEADLRGESLNAVISTGLFEAISMARQAESEEDPSKRIALMNKAALAAARLTTSSVNQRKWRAEVDSKTKAAADKVSKLAKKGGMDAKTVAEIRASILGIVKREPAQPQGATA